MKLEQRIERIGSIVMFWFGVLAAFGGGFDVAAYCVAGAAYFRVGAGEQ